MMKVLGHIFKYSSVVYMFQGHHRIACAFKKKAKYTRCVKAFINAYSRALDEPVPVVTEILTDLVEAMLLLSKFSFYHHSVLDNRRNFDSSVELVINTLKI